MRRSRLVVVAIAASAVACGGDADTGGTTAAGTTLADTTRVTDPHEQRFPDVVDATATLDADGTWTFAVTLSSPYDGPDRYADAWRVVAPDGTVLGERSLLHHHANEQPFTRSLSGVTIGTDVDTVTIEGRDQRYGYGGGTLTIDLDPTTS